MPLTCASVRADRNQWRRALLRLWVLWGADAVRATQVHPYDTDWIHSGSEHLEFILSLWKHLFWDFGLFLDDILFLRGERSGLRPRNWRAITLNIFRALYFACFLPPATLWETFKTHFSHRSSSALFTPPPPLAFLTKSPFETSLVDLITLPFAILAAHFACFPTSLSIRCRCVPRPLQAQSKPDLRFWSVADISSFHPLWGWSDDTLFLKLQSRFVGARWGTELQWLYFRARARYFQGYMVRISLGSMQRDVWWLCVMSSPATKVTQYYLHFKTRKKDIFSSPSFFFTWHSGISFFVCRNSFIYRNYEKLFIKLSVSGKDTEIDFFPHLRLPWWYFRSVMGFFLPCVCET